MIFDCCLLAAGVCFRLDGIIRAKICLFKKKINKTMPHINKQTTRFKKQQQQTK